MTNSKHVQPTNMDELNAAYKINTAPFGSGFGAGVAFACPFCAAPDWVKSMLFDGVKPGPLIRNMSIGATCVECERSAKVVFTGDGDTVSFEIVQTGGPELPEWWSVPVRRI